MKIAALGSSFAAGPGIEPVVDKKAMRSGANYAHLLAERLGAELTDLTVSGATIANIINTPQRVSLTKTYQPQILGIPKDADIVTITAGGNDMSFLGSMLHTAWRDKKPNGVLTRIIGKNLKGGIPAISAAQIQAVANSLSTIVDAVKVQSKSARIVLVDYVTIITQATPNTPLSPFKPDEIEKFIHIQESLAKAFKIAAKQSHVELLDITSLSTDHALGSENPWVYGFHATAKTTGRSFHPNKHGMKAVADELFKMLA